MIILEEERGCRVKENGGGEVFNEGEEIGEEEEEEEAELVEEAGGIEAIFGLCSLGVLSESEGGARWFKWGCEGMTE